MLNSKCCNQGSAISNKFKPDVSTSFPTQTTHSNEFVPQQQTLSETLSFADQKMIAAFGVTLTNSEGEIRSGYIDKIWERTVWLRGRMYRVPGGAVGRYFTSILAKEIQALANDEQKSEKSAMLSKLILQKDKKIVKSSDIRRLLRRRMKMWEEDLFDQLIEEAELCDRKFGRAVGENMSENKPIKC